jgi:ribosomal protein S18 acetylase RimI-like enzyme
VHPLDNPAWHALSGPQHHLGERTAGAARYDPAVAPFAALPARPSPAGWRALGELLGPRDVAVLFRDQVPVPDGWQEMFRIPTVQMTGAGAQRGASTRASRLGPGDVDAMLALVHETRPGPFARRTIELGTYLGICEGAALVAMAGERMRLPGHTEISAVCTGERHRGRGLASELVRALVAAIVARGEVPFLHVVAENAVAIRLYEALGFTTRRMVEVVALRPPSADASPPA